MQHIYTHIRSARFIISLLYNILFLDIDVICNNNHQKIMKLDDSILVFDIDLFLIMKLDDPIFMYDINLFLILHRMI